VSMDQGQRESPDRQSAQSAEEVTGAWRSSLRAGGYEAPRQLSGAERRRLTRYSSLWRWVVRHLGVRPGWSFLELGCGGGAHIVPLAFHGHPCVGLDCSADVLERLRAYVRLVEGAERRQLPLDIVLADFNRYATNRRFDVVFQVGVLEHFLQPQERLGALQRMFDLTKPGGFVLSIVPSGMHPLRRRQREQKLGGYDIPEIDYSDRLLEEELHAVGAGDVQIFPWNLFGYGSLHGGLEGKVWRAIQTAARGAPVSQRSWKFRHAYSLIGVGRKRG
jgi:SAM-dependent methyltransferase